MIKAVIFDMGGVMVRTEDRVPRAQLGARYDQSYEQMDELVFNSESALRATVGEIPEEEHWRSVTSGLNVPAEGVEEFRTAFWAGDRANEPLLALIDSLRPRYRTALLSNAWSNARRDIGEAYNILRVFDVIIFSAEVQLAKPDPRIYHYALDMLRVQPAEAVFVDDMPANVAAAQAVGMHGIRFLDTQQTIDELLTLIQ